MDLDLVIGYNLTKELKEFFKINNVNRLYVITDTIVSQLYMKYIDGVIKNWDYNTYIIPSGEESKNMDTVFSIYNDLLDSNIDRNTYILAFGGGVVGDIAGFVASTYKRGLKYVQIPTTLLSQIDSSIGGKVGVDYGGHKKHHRFFLFSRKSFYRYLFSNYIA